MWFNFLLHSIKNYKQDAFKIQEKLLDGRVREKDMIIWISSYLIQTLTFLKFYFYDECKL